MRVLDDGVRYVYSRKVSCICKVKPRKEGPMPLGMGSC